MNHFLATYLLLALVCFALTEVSPWAWWGFAAFMFGALIIVLFEASE